MKTAIEERLKSDNKKHRFSDIRELIGNHNAPTPLVKLNSVIPAENFELYLKLEWFNPFGSIKDRTAFYLLKGMADNGMLDGKELVEPTSGNTGIALAALAGLMGKKLTVTVPDEIPQEKQILLRMLGAEVWATPDDLCPIDHPKDGAIALAHSFSESEQTKDKYAMPNQYENHDNVRAHYETTGPEIWEQTEGKIDYFLAGLGTCGTISGTGKYLKEQKQDVEVYAMEPQKGHRIPGLKNMEESKLPGIYAEDVVDDIIRVDDGPAYEMTRRLFREEGLMVGPSTGAIVRAAATLAEQGREGLAVAVSPDGGQKYTSYFADMLGDEGLPQG